MRILEEVPDPDEDRFAIDVDELDSQVSMVRLQERPSFRRAASSQNRGLQPELRMMVQTLQQQLAEHKEREEKLLAQLEQQKLREEKREMEQKEREEKREAERKGREAERKEREEKLLDQLKQQKLREDKREAGQKELQGKLLALLEQKEKSK
ncbi:hypothetical protein N7451_012462 [Penicillium sp. IBT 35674x]|nr:hypothetical protein N7451_012462 [Penicillium sp. IBT 35674x]